MLQQLHNFVTILVCITYCTSTYIAFVVKINFVIRYVSINYAATNKKFKYSEHFMYNAKINSQQFLCIT
jgi:hypothetical protein